MKIPAKYSHTIYKFRVPKLPSEQQFIKIKSTEKVEYLKNIKGRIKKEKRVYKRHHWLNLITLWINIILVLSVILLILISIFLKFDFISGINQLITISFICLIISIIALFVLQIRGFFGSFLSFRRYVKEKYNYYCELKETIDDSKDFYSYKGKDFE